MPGPSAHLLRIARATDDAGPGAAAWLANPKPSQLVDDLDTADLLLVLERLEPTARLADAAASFRAASAMYAITKGTPLAGRYQERAVALYLLVRRTLTEVRAAAGVDTETGAQLICTAPDATILDGVCHHAGGIGNHPA